SVTPALSGVMGQNSPNLLWEACGGLPEMFDPSSRLRTDVVEVPPRIVHHPSDVVVKVGSPATLSCRADGTPEPSIDQSRVVPGRRSQSHEGVYACMARNSAGKATSRNASLFIAGKTVGMSFKLDGHKARDVEIVRVIAE
uniref:Ig-like domain-containing protein n=1 Tax=Salmo trutta TaxID=8032 RepID=A0A673WSB7_SALTR